MTAIGHGYGFNPLASQVRLAAQRQAPRNEGSDAGAISGAISQSATGAQAAERSGDLAIQGLNETESVANRFEEFVVAVNDQQHLADQAQMSFANGDTDDIHGTMIQMQKADIQFRLLGNIRNRAIEAYREIMRMGV